MHARIDQPRRGIAKVEWHPGELVPRVGFIVTNLSRPAERVIAFYNRRGTAEQWIKEGKGAIRWTRLSCRSFAANEHREQRSMATRRPRCVHERPRSAESCPKGGREPLEAGRCGRRGRFEPSQACQERRNGRLSALGSRSSGESRLTGLDANTAIAGNQAFHWVSTSALTGAGQLGYLTAGGNTIIRGSNDADAASEFEIQLNGIKTLTAEDFYL